MYQLWTWGKILEHGEVAKVNEKRLSEAYTINING